MVVGIYIYTCVIICIYKYIYIDSVFHFSASFFWLKALYLDRMARGTTKNAWSWARESQNPGLVRLKKNKHVIGVFHALPCSLLKAARNAEKEKSVSPIHIVEDDRKAPLSNTLTMVLRQRTPEKIDEDS